MASRLNPVDIPKPARYDFVTLQAGDMRTDDGPTPAIVAMIDNGPHKGKRVTSPVGPAVARTFHEGRRFSAWLHVLPSAFVDGEEVPVPITYQDANVRVRYRLDAFRAPDATAEIEPRNRRAKFRRRNA